MSHEGDPLPSLTRQLRELHQRLDPQAPRHLANGKRKQAITALLAGGGSGASADGGSSGGDQAGTNGGAAGSSRPRPATARRSAAGRSGGNGNGRREVGGVRLPTLGQPPSGGRSGQPQRADARNNAERLWRYLFG